MHHRRVDIGRMAHGSGFRILSIESASSPLQFSGSPLRARRRRQCALQVVASCERRYQMNICYTQKNIKTSRQQKLPSSSSAFTSTALAAAPGPVSSIRMSMRPETSDCSGIQQFFHDRSLFITGASGFIGNPSPPITSARNGIQMLPPNPNHHPLTPP